MILITQKLSSILDLRSAHSSDVAPSPTDILDEDLSQARDSRTGEDVRFHNCDAQFFHLLYIMLILLSEARYARPLVLSPQRLGLVRILYWVI